MAETTSTSLPTVSTPPPTRPSSTPPSALHNHPLPPHVHTSSSASPQSFAPRVSTTTSPSSKKLTLYIRSPNLSDAISVDTSLDTSIRSLKGLLKNVFPGSPDITAQRLIYGGKLLTDTDLISSVLQKVKILNPFSYSLFFVVSEI